MNGYRNERMPTRPPSDQMADLHIYLVPPEIWRDKFNNALNARIDDTISLGFIRVHPQMKVQALRDEIEQQLGGVDLPIPREYVFLKSVGRSLTRLKSRQESQLKVKNFLPPNAYAPELYLLEATPAVLAMSSSEGSTRPPTQASFDVYEPYVPPAATNGMTTATTTTAPGIRQRLTPDETRHGNHNDVLDRRKNEADLNGEPRVQTPEKSRDHERNQAWATERLTDRDRQNHTEMARRRLEEENQANSEMNERNIGDDDVKETKADSDDETTQYPSPPPLRLSSPGRDTESAKENRRKQKDLLAKELEEVMVVRRNAERQREELVKQAKHMQNNMQNKRNHARDIWKKRYFEEKRKTGPFEEQCTRLRHELEIIHKKLLSTLEGPKEKATKLTDMKPPSHKNNFKIQATRLQHQIEDVRQRVDYAKMKLTGEMKLRNQAETELRALRAELTQKKINLTLSRNSQLTAYAPPASDVKLYQTLTARHGITPHS